MFVIELIRRDKNEQKIIKVNEFDDIKYIFLIIKAFELEDKYKDIYIYKEDI